MALRELSIQGYRTLRDVTWAPGPLNIVIGQNGSGKTNLLNVLRGVARLAAGELGQAILDEGGLLSMLWDGKATGITGRLVTDGSGANDQVPDRPLAYEVAIQKVGIEGAWQIGSELLSEAGSDPGGKWTSRRGLLERRGNQLVLIEGMGQPAAPGVPLAPDAVLLWLAGQSLLPSSAQTLAQRLRRWRIHQDIRVDRQAEVRIPAVTRMESRLDPDGQNLVPVLHTLSEGNPEFRETLQRAMTAAFPGEFEGVSFPPAADGRIQIRIKWRSQNLSRPLFEMSDGTLRFLMIVTALANPDPGELIAIDQPESGLHPSMFPIIAELAAEASSRTQLIFTTHSPQFLDAFSSVDVTTTVAQIEGGATHLSVLDRNELKRWLDHYSLGYLFQTGELENLS